MANKHRGQVDIELDKPRVVKYDLNAFAEIEDRFNVPVSKIGEIEMGLKQVRTLLWAGLIHEDEALTEKQVGALVDFSNLEYVNQKIVEAFSNATGAKN